MTDILCSIMGVLDIIAGVTIMFCFDFATLAMIFGFIMIGKGGFSFI